MSWSVVESHTGGEGGGVRSAVSAEGCFEARSGEKVRGWGRGGGWPVCPDAVTSLPFRCYTNRRLFSWLSCHPPGALVSLSDNWDVEHVSSTFVSAGVTER